MSSLRDCWSRGDAMPIRSIDGGHSVLFILAYLLVVVPDALNLVTIRSTYTITPAMFVSALVQYKLEQ